MAQDILIVEDDQEIVYFLEIQLHGEGYNLNKAYDELKGLKKALEEVYELIILDLMLPEMDGNGICQKLRGKEIYTPHFNPNCQI